MAPTVLRVEPALAHLADHLAALVGLPGASLSRGGEVDWSRWLELVHEHDLAPLLGSRVLAAERAGGQGASLPHASLPPDVVDDLRAAHALWSHETLFRATELRAVLDLLAPVGGAIVLKGPAVAVTHYRDLGERRSNDIDLLVRDREARARALDILAARGYRRKHAPANQARAAAASESHDLGLVSEVADLEVDLHVDIVRAGLPPAALDDLWTTRRALDLLGGIAVLDPAWQALHAAVHALSDPIGSPLLRNLLETGMLAARLDTAGRAAFVERARRFGLVDRAARALGLAQRLFGSPALLAPPRPGARELWAWRRLGWRYDDDHVVGRTLAHVAEYHLRRLDDARDSGLGVRALARTLADVAAGHVTRRIAAARAPRAERLRPVAATSRAIGDALLVHVHATGDIHVLRDDAITAWHGLAAGGRAADCTDAALAALVDAGLLA